MVWPENAYLPQAADIRCEDCRKGQDESNAARRLKIEETSLNEIPAAFRKTAKDQLPQPDKLDEALAWKYGQRGLMLYGPTRCGKSRIVWEVIKREVKAGRSFRAVNPFELLRYPALFMAGNDAAGKFAESCAKVDLLLLDDAFKAKLTERVEELLFAVINERSEWNRPCLVTLNDTGATLGGRVSGDRGPALIARLREFCQPIAFETKEVRPVMADQ